MLKWCNYCQNDVRVDTDGCCIVCGTEIEKRRVKLYDDQEDEDWENEGEVDYGEEI